MGELKFYISVSLKTNLRLLQILGWTSLYLVYLSPFLTKVLNKSPVIAVKKSNRKRPGMYVQPALGCASESKEDGGVMEFSINLFRSHPVAVLYGVAHHPGTPTF